MDKFYRKVPQEQVEQLMRFRQEHPLKLGQVEGVPWEYLLSGTSTARPLLLMPGALGTAESAWRTIRLLEETGKYRLLCPNYPPDVGSMDGLADGIAGLLSQEGLQSVSLVGGSYGGMVAQVFVHRHPSRVSNLVLSHTYPPEKNRVRNVQPALRLLRLAPMPMVKKILRERMTGILPPSPSPELLLIAGQISETVDTRFTRQSAINTFLRMVDFDQQQFNPTDLENWPGKTLIMLAEDDPTTPPPLRKKLLELYPGARVHLFKESGHATSILEAGEYIRLIDEFLEETGQ